MPNIISPEGAGDIYLTPYKSYVALLHQAGTDAPTAIIMNENDTNFLGNIVWSYEGIGYYKGTLTGQLTINKTFTIISNNLGALTRAFAIGEDVLPDTIYIECAADGSNADDVLNNTPIEVRVYP